MHPGPFTRTERRLVRELAGLAYERELGAALAELEEAFAEWRAGRLSPHDVSDRVHAFHQGPARTLYTLYANLPPEHAAARGVAIGLLAPGEVAPELLERLGSVAAFYRPGPAGGS